MVTRPCAATNGKPDRRSDLTVIYFLLVRELDGSRPRIKIGESGEFFKRLKTHEYGRLGEEYTVDPLACVRGTPNDERAIHRAFLQYRLRGLKEVFEPHGDVVDYIRWLRDQYFVWVPDDEHCDSIDALPVQDSSAWLPSPERVKPKPDILPGMYPLDLAPRELTCDDFYTGPDILDAVRDVMGAIDLDPASHPVANREVRAERFFTIAENGLVRRWAGRVWLNPPFSVWKQWVPKIVDEWRSGDVDEMMVLCATRTLTAQYFFPIHENCDAACITHGRFRFWGRIAAQPDDGHAIFYFGRKVESFLSRFSKLGSVYIGTKGGK